MLPFRRILFPVDYSQPCDDMVPYVQDMVRHCDAELTLVRAYGAESAAYAELFAADEDWPRRVRDFEEERLKKFVCGAFPGRHVELRVAQGQPEAVIHQVVEREGTDLVMMPTRGQGPVRRFLLGSVTAKVLHDISAAVWTSTSSGLVEHQTNIPYKSILCALDETAEAEAVLTAAASISQRYGAQLHLVHAVPTPAASVEIDIAVYRKDLMDAADFKLRELKNSLEIQAPHLVVEGSLPTAIRQEALRTKTDLLVLGRGDAQGALRKIWSNLYEIVRESPCPVLSI